MNPQKVLQKLLKLSKLKQTRDQDLQNDQDLNRATKIRN